MFRLIFSPIALLITLPSAMAIPSLSFNGKIEQEQLVILNVQVEATGSSEVCFTTTYRDGVVTKNTHVYDMTYWSMSNFSGYYALDYSTEARLDNILMESFKESGINGIDYKTYMKTCDFKIKKVELNLFDTHLILTHSKDAKTDLVLELDSGTTRAHVFNFDQGRSLLWFKVNLR